MRPGWHCERAPARSAPLSVRAFAAEDLAGNGRLDLLAVGGDGQPVRLANRGTRDYHWQDVRVIANELARKAGADLAFDPWDVPEKRKAALEKLQP